MRRRILAVAGVLAAMALGGAGLAAASGGSNGSSSAGSNDDSGGGTSVAATPSAPRLDDGANLLPKAQISEQQADRAAQSAASGALNEDDLEYYNGRLVWNVDVGSADVKVDASNGDVLATLHDD